MCFHKRNNESKVGSSYPAKTDAHGQIHKITISSSIMVGLFVETQVSKLKAEAGWFEWLGPWVVYQEDQGFKP